MINKNILFNITIMLTLYLLQLSYVYASEYKNDLQEYELKGKVKTFISNKYAVTTVGKSFVKGRRIGLYYDHFDISFNRHGQVTKKIEYDTNNKIHETNIPKYINNKKVSLKTYMSGNTKSYNRYVYRYDMQNNLVVSRMYMSDGSLFKVEHYKYDNRGNNTFYAEIFKIYPNTGIRRTYKYD